MLLSERRLPASVRTGLILAFLSVFFALPALGDVISLKNGDVLRGRLAGFDGSTLVLKSAYAGTLKLPANAIAGITTDGPVTIRVKGGGYFTGRLQSAYGGELRIVSDSPPSSAPVAFASIAEIHPGTEVPRGFKWTGRANLGASKRSGNTDTKSLHADGHVTGRAPADRIRFRGEINRETDDGRRTEDDFRILVQHDHFVRKKVYFYTNAKLEQDKPANLNLRTTIGTGIGYQVFESKRRNLSFEGGPSYTNEDLVASPDRDYIAGRWALDFDQYVWRDIVQLFHHHEGTVDLAATDDIFVNSTTGFRLPLGNGFNVTVQLDFDWDNKPPAGKTSTDKRYLLTLGYAW